MSLLRVSAVRRTLSYAALPLLAVSLTACSGSSGSSTPAASSAAAPSTTAAPAVTTPKASDVATKVKAAIAAAKSAHIQGTGMNGGSKMTLDVMGTVDGSNGTMTMTMGPDQNFTVVVADGGYYVKGSSGFWKAQAPTLDTAVLAEKWVKVPADKGKQIAAVSVGSLLSSMTKDFDTLGEDVTADKVGGLDVWVVTDAKGAAEGQFFIDAKTFLPVKYTQTKDQSEVTFSEWNAVAPSKAPTEGVLNL